MDHKQVELLAYQFWQERGAPFNLTPEIDWFRAEDELRAGNPLLALAKNIGSTLGSVAALVNSGGEIPPRWN